MGKKKNLKESITELEMEFIEQKMKGDCALNYLTSEGLCSKLKTLGYKIDIKCKNEKQKEFLKLLKNKNYQICFGVGSPGTGKSYLSLAYALKELKDGNYSNIIMMIPTAPAGGLDLNLGYLKGDLETKIQPYLECDEQTITKILRNSGNADPYMTAQSLISNNYIKYEFINFALGKTFDNALICVNECEQYTKENLRLILTRLGENSKMILTGDSLQTNRRDIVTKKSESGLLYAIEHIGKLDEVGITEFTREDIVRNPLITKILDNWD